MRRQRTPPRLYRTFEGDFHWHKHATEDEFFLVHRPRAAGRTVLLMVEPATVVPTGDD